MVGRNSRETPSRNAADKVGLQNEATNFKWAFKMVLGCLQTFSFFAILTEGNLLFSHPAACVFVCERAAPPQARVVGARSATGTAAADASGISLLDHTFDALL